MQVTLGTKNVPVIYSAHHASQEFHEFSDRVALSPEQQIRFSDYGTAQTVPQNGIASVVAEHSRALGDLNRNANNPDCFMDRDFAQPNANPIWLSGQELSAAEKQACTQRFYEPFHAKIIELLQQQTEPVLVVSWDNTAPYKIGVDASGQPATMKPIILSNRGDENSPSGSAEQVSCDPALLKALAGTLSTELAARNLPHDVFCNYVFKGGYICQTYSSLRNDTFLRANSVHTAVQSLQVEYDTSITHDVITLQPKPDAMRALTDAFIAAIETTLRSYNQQS